MDPGLDSTFAIDILDTQTTAVMVVSAERVVRYLNPAAEHLYGISDSQGAGSTLAEVFAHPDEAFGDLASTLDSGHSYTHREQEIELRDGTQLVADVTVCRIHATGDLLIEAQARDRVLRINQDDRLIAAERTTASLVRGLAHEVKNPLGGIRGAAQLLQRELNADDQLEYTNIIIRESDRLAGLVDTLLGPTREPRVAPINVHHLLEHVLLVLRAELDSPAYEGAAIEFVRDYDPSLPELEGDEDQLIQALLNLMSNACQALLHTDEPCITVRTRVQRQFTIAGQRHRLCCQIDVIDNGPGVSPEIAERIFFPMISGRPDGTGLGLAITQAIVRRHQGVIEFESRPGHTMFSVLLPMQLNNNIERDNPTNGMMDTTPLSRAELESI